MKERSTCYGCDYAYEVSELTLDIVHQYGEVRLCGECLPKYGETRGVNKCDDCESVITLTLEAYGNGQMMKIDCPKCGLSYDTNLDPIEVEGVSK